MDRCLPLHRLAVGQAGTVRELLATGSLRRRLQDLGVVVGRRVYCLHRSLSGDPTAFGICHGVFALRDRDAARILVEPEEVAEWD